jgi:hypothetical protein
MLLDVSKSYFYGWKKWKNHPKTHTHTHTERICYFEFLKQIWNQWTSNFGFSRTILLLLDLPFMTSMDYQMLSFFWPSCHCLVTKSVLPSCQIHISFTNFPGALFKVAMSPLLRHQFHLAVSSRLPCCQVYFTFSIGWMCHKLPTILQNLWAA